MTFPKLQCNWWKRFFFDNIVSIIIIINIIAIFRSRIPMIIKKNYENHYDL